MSITIDLTEELRKQLAERAAELNLSSEELAAVAVRELLSHRDERFNRLLDRVLDENKELYQRLG